MTGRVATVSTSNSAANSGRGASLTRQMLLDAIEKVRNQPLTVCVGSDRHVVHPAEAERGGLARCAACFAVIDLGERP